LRESVTSRFVNGDVINQSDGYTLKRAFSRSSSKPGGGLGGLMINYDSDKLSRLSGNEFGKMGAKTA
jgi:hypothetical protein